MSTGDLTIPPETLIRPTARLIVLDAAGRVLLFKVEDYGIVDPLDPRGVDRPTICWITPGGGVDEGETYEEAALRELREETGLTIDHLGPCLCDAEWLLYFNAKPVLLQQRFYLVCVPVGDVSLVGLNAAEQATTLDHRWWTLAELESTDEAYFPENLSEIVRQGLDASTSDAVVTSAPRPRPTARLIVLDDQDRVLLFKYDEDAAFGPSTTGRPTVYWTTPGGGVEEGETFEEAAHRELWEETGLRTETLISPFFEREELVVFNDGAVLFQQRFYLVRATTPDISLDGFNALEQSLYRDHRWWTVTDLESTSDVYYPVNLPEIIRRTQAMR